MTTPYYQAQGNEVALFEAAYVARLPVMVKGPTGCGKSRFVEHMAHRLGRPLITVACNEDMTASDLLGRFLLDASGTRWQDGPLTVAARTGAICYLDEIVEARQDTTVVIHPLTDHRRLLPLDKKGETVHAHPGFQLVISYNPGYQSLLKDLKPSTKQRRHCECRVGSGAPACRATGTDSPCRAPAKGPWSHRGHLDPAVGLCGHAHGRRSRCQRGVPHGAGAPHHGRR
jgi:MoxR-like ATPase